MENKDIKQADPARKSDWDDQKELAALLKLIKLPDAQRYRILGIIEGAAMRFEPQKTA